ncbi:Sister chromatid cohesion 1 protein [Thalictrum thalictroides]|uniref:Sister chromatid cohesion 1 protein n=1 Tax=Thalictrum thalictroides TaxID=46969 RepID=A0A7J6WEF6_THATH|nr:Sister chromatid cohesion 1 protein [Thalictrum thalictroides]
MFYSQYILSKKGPLKPIWVAAYFHKRLKKEQVTETDISSSVDQIRQNVITVTYRVLGYLLLGVVRIYSKKVEYLYDDCNEALKNIKSSVPLKKSKEGMWARYSSITLPERFELDSFDLEISEDMSGGNTIPHQRYILEERSEDAGNMDYSFTKYFQEEGLAHFETGNTVHTTVRGESTAWPQKFMLEERFDDADNLHITLDKDFHDNEFTRFETSDTVRTPTRDVLSPRLMDKYTEVYPSPVPTGLETSVENLQGSQLPEEEFIDCGGSSGDDESVEPTTQTKEFDKYTTRINFMGITPLDLGELGIFNEGDPLVNADTPSHIPTGSEASMENLQGNQLPTEEFIDCGRSCGDDESVEPTTQNKEVDKHKKRIEFMGITPLESGELGIFNKGDPLANIDTPSYFPTGSEASIEKLQGNQLPREKFVDCGRSGGNDEFVELALQNKEVDRPAKRIKFLEITPSDLGELDIFKKGDPLANTEIPSHVPIGSEAATPSELMVIHTPSKKESFRFSRKRKRPLDNAIILSNEVIRQGLDDSSSLVVSRRIAPRTALGVWKKYKLPKFYQNFLEPLIPCTPQHKTRLYRRKFVTPKPLETSEIPVNLGEDRYAANKEPSERSPPETNTTDNSTLRLCETLTSSSLDIKVPTTSGPSSAHREPSEESPYSETNTMDHSTWSSFETPTTNCLDTAISDGESSLSETETEAQDIGLNLKDEELHPGEEESNENQYGWSHRTRKVAGFLRKSFLDRKECGNTEPLNLNPVLNNKTKKESARLFYEILVLKSRGLVDVKQDTPYDDICLLSTPKLVPSD